MMVLKKLNNTVFLCTYKITLKCFDDAEILSRRTVLGVDYFQCSSMHVSNHKIESSGRFSEHNKVKLKKRRKLVRRKYMSCLVISIEILDFSSMNPMLSVLRR
jgi:hypothetical protein